MKKIIYLIITCILITIITACKTIDVEETHKNESEEEVETVETQSEVSSEYNFVDSMEIEDNYEPSDTEVMVEEVSKVNDVASAIIYLEPPEIIYGDVPQETQKLKGSDALIQNMKDITILPEYVEGRLKGWTYKEGQIYQVHTQTYHSTLIQFEPGEEMLEVPYISEPDVWRLSRGIGIKDGQDTQYLIIKPDYSGLISTLIVITNRRVYQMELKSYKDHYMPTVKWIYPQTVSDSQSWINWQQKKDNKAVLELKGTNIEFCSFDYKITHPLKKPVWCPELVYDDGKFTYIVLDRTALHTSMPTAFIGSRKLVNTQVNKNVIIINQLIKKVTLRLGKEKVTVTKKKK